jgi:hypothetical protein
MKGVEKLRNWNLNLLEVFNNIMNWSIDLIQLILQMSPQEFSPGGFSFAQNVGTALVPIGMSLVALFFFIDLFNNTIQFKKDFYENVKLFFHFIFGAVIVRSSFWLTQYIFRAFQSVLTTIGATQAIDMAGTFTSFTANVEAFINERTGNGGVFSRYVLGSVENTVLFIFLIFTLLGMFGMILSVVLVPIMIFIELFLLSAFAPLPMSTLLTSQKQIGIGYLKSLASVSLRGAVVMFSIFLSSNIMSAGVLTLNIVGQGIMSVFIPIIQMTISVTVLKKAMKSSEQMTRILTGG